MLVATSRPNRRVVDFEAWRQRRLQEHWRILYLDGIRFSIRHGDQADSTIILTALGVDVEGNKEVLALRACAEESKEGWLSSLSACLLSICTQHSRWHLGNYTHSSVETPPHELLSSP